MNKQSFKIIGFRFQGSLLANIRIVTFHSAAHCDAHITVSACTLHSQHFLRLQAALDSYLFVHAAFKIAFSWLGCESSVRLYDFITNTLYPKALSFRFKAAANVLESTDPPFPRLKRSWNVSRCRYT